MRRHKTRGFTLIELMIVVAIIGVLAVLAVFGVRKYLANSKTAEARSNIGQMSKDMGLAYEKEAMNGAILAPGAVAPISHQLCTNPSTPVPNGATFIKGDKYQSKPTPGQDWQADQATNGGFSCLKFTIDQPQYYMYNFTVASGGGANTTLTDTVTFTANGDLNGDGVLSTFSISAGLTSGVYTVAPSITEVNPDE